MVEYSGPWTEADVRAFLEEARIPVRLATRTPNGSPWIVALWYRYRDGCFECATEANAHLVAFLRGDPTVGFDVSTNEIPYRGVRGAGTASVTEDAHSRVLRALVERYLDGTDSTLAAGLLADDREEVRIRVEPDRVHSWDFADRMRDVSPP